jgi:hypothetical protein
MSLSKTLDHLEVTMIQLNDGRTVLGYNVEETDDHIGMYYPVVIVLTDIYSLNTSVVGYKYSPFSEKNVVVFNKVCVMSNSDPEERVRDFYKKLVEYYESVHLNIAMSKEFETKINQEERGDDGNETNYDPNSKSRILH